MTKPRYPREAWVFYDKDGDPVQIVDTTDGDFLMIAGKCYCKTCFSGYGVVDWYSLYDITGPARELAEALCAERRGDR